MHPSLLASTVIETDAVGQITGEFFLPPLENNPRKAADDQLVESRRTSSACRNKLVYRLKDSVEVSTIPYRAGKS